MFPNVSADGYRLMKRETRLLDLKISSTSLNNPIFLDGQISRPEVEDRVQLSLSGGRLEQPRTSKVC